MKAYNHNARGVILLYALEVPNIVSTRGDKYCMKH